MLKSKIQRATVTEAALEPCGPLKSEAKLEFDDVLVLDRELMRRADLWPYEQVEVASQDNGARLNLTVIEAASGSGVVGVYGPAALVLKNGHRLVITSYLHLSEAELPSYRPRIVTLDSKNRLRA